MTGVNVSVSTNGSVPDPAFNLTCISFGQDVVDTFVDLSFAKDRLHVIVFLGVVCALGTTGNLLVILVNAPRKDKSSATIFVLTLAVVDLFICAVDIPVKIVEIQRVTYTSTVWCKLTPYLTLASLLSSVFLLIAIAVDRYRAVARPVKYRLSRNRSVPAACVLTVLSGYLVAVPAVLLQDEVRGIRVGPACETVSLCASVGGILHGRIFFGVTAAVFFASVIAMLALYALVYKHVMDLVHPLPQGASVWTALQHRLPRPGAPGLPSSGPSVATTQPQASCTESHQSEPHRLPRPGATDLPSAPSGPSVTTQPQASCLDSHESEPRDAPQKHGGRQREEREVKKTSQTDQPTPSHASSGWRRTRLSAGQRQYRVAKLLLLVTSVFVLSWLPYWVISLRDVDRPSWLLPQPQGVKSTVVFFSHVYFVNNAANPVIYTFVQKDFRDRLAKLFRRCRN